MEMVKASNELYVTVPSFFRCPISNDVMKSPVSLCTGVTYDRSSIQTWLDSGHHTCPVTMQVLDSTDVVPNLTLRRLIGVWSDSLLLCPRSESDASPSWILAPTISNQQVVDLIKNVIKNKNNSYSNSLSKIVDFAKYSDENRKFLVNLDDFAPTIVGLLSNVDEVGDVELIITVLDLLKSESEVKEQLHRLMSKRNRDCLTPFVMVLQKGSLNSKIKSARVLESIAFDAESKRAITGKQGLLYELYRLVSSDTNGTALDAGLSTLIAVSTSTSVKKELVRFGIVRTAGKILSSSETVVPIIEKALKLLEMVSTCTEGRKAICENESCVSAIMQRLMKVSTAATEHGVVVLWNACYMFRDQTAQEAVMNSNRLMKLLLVMQSNCSAGVRLMCGDLVKVFRVNSKSLLASYESRSIHIRPY